MVAYVLYIFHYILERPVEYPNFDHVSLCIVVLITPDIIFSISLYQKENSSSSNDKSLCLIPQHRLHEIYRYYKRTAEESSGMN